MPRLSVVAEIPNSLQVEDELSTMFIVTNSGNGDADAVVLTVAVPGGLEHRDGVLVSTDTPISRPARRNGRSSRRWPALRSLAKSMQS